MLAGFKFLQETSTRATSALEVILVSHLREGKNKKEEVAAEFTKTGIKKEEKNLPNFAASSFLPRTAALSSRLLSLERRARLMATARGLVFS